MEISYDVILNEYSSLGKPKYLPITRKENDDVVGKQDKYFTHEPMIDVEALLFVIVHIPDKVVPDINMLGVIMEHKIF